MFFVHSAPTETEQVGRCRLHSGVTNGAGAERGSRPISSQFTGDESDEKLEIKNWNGKESFFGNVNVRNACLLIEPKSKNSISWATRLPCTRLFFFCMVSFTVNMHEKFN